MSRLDALGGDRLYFASRCSADRKDRWLLLFSIICACIAFSFAITAAPAA